MRGLVVLAVAVLALPTSANLDPVTGDFSWIDFPTTGTAVSGLVLLEGRAGNGMVPATCGSEGAPQATDPQGDFNVGGAEITQTIDINGEKYGPTDDVGNTWVCNDDGSSFDVKVRLWEGATPATTFGGVMYWVRFTHAGPFVVYEAWAWQDETGGWMTQLMAHTSDGQPCEVGKDIAASFATSAPGGILTYAFDYSDLWLTATPADDCTIATGGAAAAGDDLMSFSAGSANLAYDPITGFWGYNERDTIPPGASAATWTMGGGPPPAGPFTPVTLYVNGNLEATFATQNAPGLTDTEWELTLDFDLLTSIGCDFEVEVFYGTASDAITLKEIGCGPPPPPPPPPVVRPDNPRAPSGFQASTGGRVYENAYGDDMDLDGTPDGADACMIWRDQDTDADTTPDDCDPDIDNDGVMNGADNCPYHANGDQEDTDHDGIGNVCLKAMGMDEDGDGIADHLDNCPTVFGTNQADLDRDGVGNVCDEDLDGDGVRDQDLGSGGPLEPPQCRYNPAEWEDRDGDGICDNADLDWDNDGFSNAMELAAGTDPYVKDQSIEGSSPRLHTAAAAPGALGSVLILVGLVALGVVLFLLLGRRKE